MSKSAIQLVFLSFMLTLPLVQVHADDSIAALGAGGIELLRSEHIVMEEQDLFLSSRRIHTRFLFRNESASDITTLVAFVMPDIFPESLYKRDDIPLLRQLGFSVSVNGQKRLPKADFRAILEGRDVTDRLRELGVRLDEDRSFVSSIPARLDSSKRATLKAEGLLHPIFPDIPGWSTRLRLYWEQTFPAGAQVEITHSYTPFLGAENLGPESLDVPAFAAAVCLTPENRRQGQALLQKPGSIARNLDYVLSTGANWKGSIGALAITIEKQHESDVVATCLPGLAVQGEMAYGVLMKNVKPMQDIHVLFIEGAQAASVR